MKLTSNVLAHFSPQLSYNLSQFVTSLLIMLLETVHVVLFSRIFGHLLER